MDSMVLRRINPGVSLVCLAACVLACLAAPRRAAASEYHGQVTFGGLPVPGATITATQGDRKSVAISDPQGNYSFADLADGTWKIEIEMQCFSTIDQTVTVAPNLPPAKWELKLLSLDQIVAKAKAVKTENKPVVVASSDTPAGTGEVPKPKDANAAEVRSRRKIPPRCPLTGY